MEYIVTSKKAKYIELPNITFKVKRDIGGIILDEEKRYCWYCDKEITDKDQILQIAVSNSIHYVHKECHQLSKKGASNNPATETQLSGRQIIITTTNHIDGYRVKKYIDIESVEVVIGTGVFSEVTAGIGDIFGLRSNAYEGKLANAKKSAMKLLKYNAYKKGGNAVIGIDIDYTEFSGNRVGLIINGTVVEIEPIA